MSGAGGGIAIAQAAGGILGGIAQFTTSFFGMMETKKQIIKERNWKFIQILDSAERQDEKHLLEMGLLVRMEAGELASAEAAYTGSGMSSADVLASISREVDRTQNESDRQHEMTHEYFRNQLIATNWEAESGIRNAIWEGAAGMAAGAIQAASSSAQGIGSGLGSRKPSTSPAAIPSFSGQNSYGVLKSDQAPAGRTFGFSF
jgi:hypothetical protein